MSTFHKLLSAFWYLFPLIIVLAALNSAWFKGKLGEFIVSLKFKLKLSSDDYWVIDNVTLPFEGGTTQIDHIIVSKFGVFVIETKNIKGWIFGGANQKTWTQKIYQQSYKFQNPLHQNYKHVRALEELLDLASDQIHSIVIFIGESTFKTEMPDNVTDSRSCISFIKSKDRPIFNESEMNQIYDNIYHNKLTPSFKVNRAHVKFLQEFHSDKDKLGNK